MLIELAERIGVRIVLAEVPTVAASLNTLANIASEQGDYAAVRVYLEESLSILREIGYRHGLAAVLHNLGNLALNLGNPAAPTYFEESLVVKRELNDTHGVALTQIMLGEVARDRGNYRAARTLFSESMVTLAELEDVRGALECLEQMAVLAVMAGQPERAARLFGAAEIQRELISAPLAPREQPERTSYITALQSTLSEESYANAWQGGRLMTLKQAVAFALGDDADNRHPHRWPPQYAKQ